MVSKIPQDIELFEGQVIPCFPGNSNLYEISSNNSPGEVDYSISQKCGNTAIIPRIPISHHIF